MSLIPCCWKFRSVNDLLSVYLTPHRLHDCYWDLYRFLVLSFLWWRRAEIFLLLRLLEVFVSRLDSSFIILKILWKFGSLILNFRCKWETLSGFVDSEKWAILADCFSSLKVSKSVDFNPKQALFRKILLLLQPLSNRIFCFISQSASQFFYQSVREIAQTHRLVFHFF